MAEISHRTKLLQIYTHIIIHLFLDLLLWQDSLSYFRWIYEAIYSIYVFLNICHRKNTILYLFFKNPIILQKRYYLNHYFLGVVNFFRNSLWAFWAENKIVKEIMKNRNQFLLKKTHSSLLYFDLCMIVFVIHLVLHHTKLGPSLTTVSVSSIQKQPFTLWPPFHQGHQLMVYAFVSHITSGEGEDISTHKLDWPTERGQVMVNMKY